MSAFICIEVDMSIRQSQFVKWRVEGMILNTYCPEIISWTVVRNPTITKTQLAVGECHDGVCRMGDIVSVVVVINAIREEATPHSLKYKSMNHDIITIHNMSCVSCKLHAHMCDISHPLIG